MALANWVVATTGIASTLCHTALFIILVILGINETQQSKPISITTFVAAGLLLVGNCCMVVELTQYFRSWRGTDTKRSIVVALIIGLLSAALTLAVLVWTSTALNVLPEYAVGASTTVLLYVAFILWAVDGVAGVLYLVARSRLINSKPRPQSMSQDGEESQASSEMQERRPSNEDRGHIRRSTIPTDSMFSRSDSIRKSSLSETFQQPVTQFVRSMNSRTQLLAPNHATKRSVDSSRSQQQHTDDAFDIWDDDASRAITAYPPTGPPPTSSHSRSYGPTMTSPRIASTASFLATIPASPTNSRSPSPGRPLDLLIAPPLKAALSRSRSHSPGTNAYTIKSTARTRSMRLAPPPPILVESHIHPLFRTDSPEPPRVSTPGTRVLAAPNAGSLILSSAHELRAMRSGDLGRGTTSHDPGQDFLFPADFRGTGCAVSLGIARTRSDNDLRRSNVVLHEWEAGLAIPHQFHDEMNRFSVASSDINLPEAPSPQADRPITPPIPDWILGAGARASLGAYRNRLSTR